MLGDFTFDYAAFYEKLLAASRQGFQLLRDRWASENFYCFGYYSHASHSFLYAVASTEEGLTRVAQHYQLQYPHYKNASLADLRTDLRYSMADSPLNDAELMLPIFQEVCDLAGKRHEELFKIWSQLDDKYGKDKAFELIKPHHEQFLKTCFSVLKYLDQEGMFGIGTARGSVLVNFLMGDQSEEEMLKYATVLNPPHIVARYSSELQAGRKIAEQRQIIRLSGNFGGDPSLRA